MPSFIVPDAEVGVASNIKTSSVNAIAMMQEAGAKDKKEILEKKEASPKGTIIYTKLGEPVFNTKVTPKLKAVFKAGIYVLPPDAVDHDVIETALDYFVSQRILTKETK
jgi:hypothetical protein